MFPAHLGQAGSIAKQQKARQFCAVSTVPQQFS